MTFAFLHTAAWQKAVTYALVTIITVLVWLYAEAENVKVHEENAVEVLIVGAKTQAIELERAQPLRVSVQFRCAAGQLAELRRLRRQPFSIDVADMDEGEQTIELKPRLALDQRIADLGVAVESVDPSRVRATITNLTPVEMEIVAESGGQRLEAVVDPPHATVLVPSRRADTARTMALIAIVDDRDLADLDEGEHPIANVTVTVPAYLREQTIMDLPDAVSVRVTVRKQEKTITRSVPIYVLGPPLVHVDFKIVPEEDVVTVDLTGPVETIERIDSNDIPVWAELHVFSHAALSEQATESTSTHPLKFRLPPDVRASVSSYEMPVVIQRREQAVETEGQ